MHRKNILLVAFLAFLAYANSLSNGFVGDDYIVIVENPFYSAWNNLPRLIQIDYISTSKFSSTGPAKKDFGSGSVSYRPVVSITYFVDRALWGLNPFGYHFFNLLLHAGNAILVYVLIFWVLRNCPTALLTAGLFAVHPLQSEAVCNIGYRADLLSLFFVLLSFLYFVRYSDAQGEKRLLYCGFSLVLFFLAIFTKESAVVLPLLLAAYSIFIRKESPWKQNGAYLGYAAVTLFYFAVYFFVFSSSSIGQPFFAGQDLLAKVGLILNVLFHYLLVFLNPFAVKLLPPFYAPDAVLATGDWVLLAVFFGSLIWAFLKLPQRGAFKFFILWFLVGFLPVSNIVPLVNPYAYRFMYLPSIGLFAALAIVVMGMCEKYFKNLKLILGSLLIGVSLAITLGLNAFWHSNLTVAREWIRNFPGHSMGHFILGLEYLGAEQYENAAASFETCQRLKGSNMNAHRSLGFDYRLPYLLGLSYPEDHQRAMGYFQQALQVNPFLEDAYAYLGRQSLAARDPDAAIPYMLRGIEVMPGSPMPYDYLIRLYISKGMKKEADLIMEKAKSSIHDPKMIEYLDQIFQVFSNKAR